MAESRTKRWRDRFSQLRSEQSDWLVHWKDVADFLLPNHGRYLNGNDSTQDNNGRKKHSKIINGSPSNAIRTLAAGLQGGLTSPSRPWFQLTLPDESLAEVESVREWLHMVRQGMMTILARSNFYGANHSEYYEIGGFGTGAMLVEEDIETVIRCRPFTIGEYCLGLDSRYRPESLYRQFGMTAGQIREKFGRDENGGAKKLPQEVESALATGKLDARFQVIHVIEKSDFVEAGRLDKRGMAYRSIYFPEAGDDDLIYKESGYRSCPFVAPRWEVQGVDTYGTSPAMAALGDIKMLQKMEEKKLKALDKMVDPPMNAPASMRQTGGTVVAGGVNYIDVQDGRQGFAPAYQVQPDMQNIAFEVDRVERRVNRCFYNDLFLSVINEDKKMTATEVARRYEEKLMMLGPVLERLQSEYMDPIIDRVFGIMAENNLLPPVPKELPAGMSLEVQYIGILAQAQKMVGNSSIEQFTGFVSQMAAVKPDVLDKVDFDEVADQYGGALGVPPKIIRSDEKVEELRQGRAQQEQAAQMAAMAPAINQGANTVQTLAQTPVQGGTATALDRLLGGAGAQ